jgi:hypothetical protein
MSRVNPSGGAEVDQPERVVAEEEAGTGEHGSDARQKTVPDFHETGWDFWAHFFVPARRMDTTP